jgi:hypothetical protein
VNRFAGDSASRSVFPSAHASLVCDPLPGIVANREVELCQGVLQECPRNIGSVSINKVGGPARSWKVVITHRSLCSVGQRHTTEVPGLAITHAMDPRAGRPRALLPAKRRSLRLHREGSRKRRSRPARARPGPRSRLAGPNISAQLVIELAARHALPPARQRGDDSQDHSHDDQPDSGESPYARAGQRPQPHHH